MRTPRLPALLLAALLVAPAAAHAQSPQRERPAPKPPHSHSVMLGGYGMVGDMFFTASDSFDTVLGSSSGPIFGGGVSIDLGIHGLVFDVGAWRYHGTGERVFVYKGEVFPLGIDVDVTATPLEVTGGWHFHRAGWPRFTPYVMGGLVSMRYREESDFATSAENDDRTFNGFIAVGGAEYKVMKFVNVAGEVTWSTIPDAIGKAGVSAAFNETDLGGTSVRFKIVVGK